MPLDVPGGTLTLGHPTYANMAQTWRDNESAAARKVFTSRYAGPADIPYQNDDCAGFYAEEGYGDFLFEACAGETMQDLAASSISSVKLGRKVHVNLYTDNEFGAGAGCGGVVQRLAYSSPSLAAFSAHHEQSSTDDLVAAVAVYLPDDRQTHARFDGPFHFHGSGDLPSCSSTDELTLLRDGVDWAGTAAILREPIDPPYTIAFDYSSKHDGDEPPADGITVFFAKDPTTYIGTPPPNGSLGFIPDGTGYAVQMHVYTNTVAVRDGNYEVIGQMIPANTYTDGAWVSVRVEVTLDAITLIWDGQELLSQQVALDTTHAGVGVGAGSGFYTSAFRIRGLSVTPG